MPEPNARLRPREKFELSLDGRQVASIVVGALVVVAVVFVLGLNVGKQIMARQLEVRRAGDLDALDRAPAPPAANPEPLTFHDRLTKNAPAPAPDPAPRAARAPAPASPPAPGPVAARAAAGAAPDSAAAPVPEAPSPASRAPSPAPLKAWTVQLAASGDRAEAARLSTRFAALQPRVEEAIVPGKGRFFRVRVGSFDTKEQAQNYLRDVGRETGGKGMVVPSR